MHYSKCRIPCDRRRGGAVVVEAALILPLLVLVSLGSIDLSQYINLSQAVANASREGARIASRNGTDDVADVENAVIGYLANNEPGVPLADIVAATTFQIVDESQAPILGGQLASVSSGSRVTVRVSFDFSVVRWLKGPTYWDSDAFESNTTCRRE